MSSLSDEKQNTTSYLIHEDRPRYDTWLKMIIGGIIAFTLIPGIVLLGIDLTAAWVMFGTTLFDALLFHAILPRRYQIFNDRVKIVLGRPFSLNIPLEDIRQVKPASISDTFVYWGIRLATSAKSATEIVRIKGLNIIISPSNRELFIEQLARTMHEH